MFDGLTVLCLNRAVNMTCLLVFNVTQVAQVSFWCAVTLSEM